VARKSQKRVTVARFYGARGCFEFSGVRVLAAARRAG
jgi:hypothetical protein